MRTDCRALASSAGDELLPAVACFRAVSESRDMKYYLLLSGDKSRHRVLYGEGKRSVI